MQISVVIPVLNEEARVESAVLNAWRAGADEVIVVDGGSSDQTTQIAKALDCRVLETEAGRATQQDAGGRAATGDVVLFLHADNRLVADGVEQIRAAMTNNESIVGGSIRQCIEASGWRYRVLEVGNRFRAKWLRLPYGDQGIFIRRSTFIGIGGFDDVPLMEDVILAKRMRKRGRVVHLDGPLFVDARRWQQYGVVRQTLRNWTLITAYHLGVPATRLANFYPRHDIASASEESTVADASTSADTAMVTAE